MITPTPLVTYFSWTFSALFNLIWIWKPLYLISAIIISLFFNQESCISSLAVLGTYLNKLHLDNCNYKSQICYETIANKSVKRLEFFKLQCLMRIKYITVKILGSIQKVFSGHRSSKQYYWIECCLFWVSYVLR